MENGLKKMKDFSTKNKSIISIVAVCFIVSMIFGLMYLLKIRQISNFNPYSSYLNERYDNNVGILTEDVEVTQTFKSSGTLAGVSIKFDGIKENDTAQVNATLETENGDKVKEWSITVAEVDSEGFINFMLDEEKRTEEENGVYKLKIRVSNLVNNSTLTIDGSKSDYYEKGELFINGEKQDYDLCIRTHSSTSPFITNIYIVFALVAIVFLGGIFYLIFNKTITIEKAFLISVLVLGIGYMFMVTPYSGFDEPAHIETAYRYSNDLMGIGHSTENGGLLKRGDDTPAGLTYGGTISSMYRTVYDNFFDLVDDEKLYESEGRDVGEPPYLYAPGALAITAARVLKLGQIPTLYLGRFVNLLCYSLLIYLAIKKIPFGKLVLFSAGLLPMALHQAASFSYDGMIMALGFLFTAYCLRVAFSKEKITKMDYICLGLFGALLAPSKTVYVVLCGLCLIIPKKRYEDSKKYYKIIFGVLFICALSFVVFNLTRALGVLSQTEATSISNTSAYTFGEIIEHPMQYLRIFLNTIRLLGINFLTGSISALWQVPISEFITVTFIVILILSSFCKDDEEPYLERGRKLWGAMIFFGIIILLYMAGYTWTPNTSTIIEGVQGRYLLPIMPLGLLLLRNRSLVYKKDITRSLMFTVCFLQVITLLNGFIAIVR